jgi:hypothetical protein
MNAVNLFAAARKSAAEMKNAPAILVPGRQGDYVVVLKRANIS